MPFYAVARGVRPGIYKTWDSCKKNVLGYKGAVYKKFNSSQQAQEFILANRSRRYQPKDDESSDSDIETPSVLPMGPFVVDEPTVLPPVVVGLARHAMSQLRFRLDERFLGIPKAFMRTETKHPPTQMKRVYVDGASRGNGRKGTPISGYGVFYGAGDARNAAVPLCDVEDAAVTKPTNQRAELLAMKHALTDIANEIHGDSEDAQLQSIRYQIYSDSRYAANCITEWCGKWIANGWKNGQGNAVANKDIIETTYPILNYINEYYSNQNWGRLEFFHVAGHSGDYGNEMADKLANEGADLMQKCTIHR
ncbi:Piso0_000041 [Millerozyma farinosa CBS 7064]|uniref:Ribonuclease H n=1 Tax=Pichia sorbitophila (strain ATCC MYA-4447 / BCRC 22081 / CBS 7064 / NBRC 10061 / NRRL Y-12695) TaxID=559304 RepID=G8YUD7_PICSO|nr:Piso0_000041 [Millerozyma farinosa CBS 7064]